MARTAVCTSVLGAVLASVACAPAASPLRGVPSRPSASAVEAFELRPEVLVDPAHATVWMAAAEGGLEALDLASGSVRWSTAHALRPLWVEGRRLLAQAATTDGGLALAAFDAARPAAPEFVAAVPLPEGVRAAGPPAPGEQFSMRVRHLPEGLFVLWSFARLPTSGVAPREGEPDGVERAHGALRVDLERRRVEAVDASAVDAAPRDELPPAVREAIVRGRAAEPSGRVGSRWTLAEVVEPGSRHGLVLRRWDADTGAALSDVPLTDGPFHLVSRSADGRHLLVSRRAGSPGVELFEWSIHDAGSGAGSGKVQRVLSATAFCVVGTRLIYELPPHGWLENGQWREAGARLEAVDLATGRSIWGRALPERRAPPPPAR